MPKQEQSEEVKENSNKLDSYPCPVCFDSLKAPKKIFQCSQGHYVCDLCLRKLKKGNNECPTCRENWTNEPNLPARNRLAEELIQKMTESISKAESNVKKRKHDDFHVYCSSHQGLQNEVLLNVEHHFMDNGKVVKKMPIEMEGRIIWVECADEEQVPKNDKNSLVLDFPAPVPNSPGPSTNSPNQTLAIIGGVPVPVGKGSMSLVAKPIKRQPKNFTEAEKLAIVDECTVELYSPILLAEKYNISVTSIRGWIKAAGKTLPQKYKFNATKHQRKLL